MQITVTGHRLDVTQAIHDFTINKFNRLEKHFDKIIKIHVIFDIEHLDQVAEATVHVSGANIHVKSKSSDLYHAIDSLVDKLDRKIIQLKEKRNSHRDHRDKTSEHIRIDDDIDS